MEQDLKILEEHLSFIKNFDNGSKYIPALENLIKAYKELEKSNQEKAKMLTEQNRNLQISYDSLQELFELRKYKNNSIPVSLVEEKIEELIKEGRHYNANKIEVLQELLEKRK